MHKYVCVRACIRFSSVCDNTYIIVPRVPHIARGKYMYVRKLF